jgi:hypothetical protein
MESIMGRYKRRDSTVRIVTDYGLEDRMFGVRIPAGTGIFLFDTVSRPALGPTQPPIQLVLGGGARSLA